MATSSIDKSLYAAPTGLAAALPEPDMEIEIENPDEVDIRMGDLEISLTPEPKTDEKKFDANLAEFMDDKDLASVVTDLIADFEISQPAVSNEGASGTTPLIATAPCVGRSPNSRQAAAGTRIDPPRSEPNSSGTMPAATAAAPPVEPPAVFVRSHGLLVRP